MRVYLPSTLPELARALAAGEIGPAPVRGYAVTPALREWYAGGDQEELEYVAMATAARASLRLLADDGQAAPRRVVLAAELPDSAVESEPGYGAFASEDARALVRVVTTVPARHIEAGHIDDTDAAEDIKAAAEALPAADGGDEDARFTVDGAEGHELLWYATQELEEL